MSPDAGGGSELVGAASRLRFMAHGVRGKVAAAVVVAPSAPRSHAVSARDLESLGGLVEQCARVIAASSVNNVARHPSRV